MKLLYLLRHPAAVRSLETLLRRLDARGHSVHLALGAVKRREAYRALQTLAEDCPRLTFDRLPGGESPGWRPTSEGWGAVVKQLRLAEDSLRYLDSRYDEADGLRARGAAKAGRTFRTLQRAAALAGPPGIAGVRGLVRTLERSIAPPPHVQRFVSDQSPDVLLVSHLADWASPHVDYLRAARRLGIRTAFPVFSWDNLTNKGVVRDAPDLVLVWNDLQAAEAAELQGIPPERIRVTGAPAYDHWFEWQPSRDREEFCREVGLRPDRPIVLYVCSSRFTVSDEVPFLRRWLAGLREAGGVLADVGVLVRPHPRNVQPWRGIRIEQPQVRLWPPLGEEPLDEESRQHYFDSIYHSAAVVGINTSAQIESAIIGRPVHTVLAEEFRSTQQGTLHFHYLRSEEFGHLYVGRTLDEHLGLLAHSILEPPDDGRNERFLRRFVRPFGLEVPATPAVVEALEELAAKPAPAAERPPALAPLVRLALAPAAVRARRRAGRDLRPADEQPSLDRELRGAVRALVREQEEALVVAGPWLGDEIGELLYWIPFLRWAEGVAYGLRERLVVAVRPGTAAWYAGVGSRRIEVENALAEGQLAGRLGTHRIRFLSASMIAVHRSALATEHLAFQQRLVELARLDSPEPLPDLEHLEGSFVARFAADAAHLDGSENRELAAAVLEGLADDGRVVVLDAPDWLRSALDAESDRLALAHGLSRANETALIAASRGFVGTYGVHAYVAALTGRPAAVLSSGPDAVGQADMRVAALLPQPQFGRLEVIETGRDRSELVSQVLATLGSRPLSPAGLGG